MYLALGYKTFSEKNMRERALNTFVDTRKIKRQDQAIQLLIQKATCINLVTLLTLNTSKRSPDAYNCIPWLSWHGWIRILMELLKQCLGLFCCFYTFTLKCLYRPVGLFVRYFEGNNLKLQRKTIICDECMHLNCEKVFSICGVLQKKCEGDIMSLIVQILVRFAS